MYKSIEKLQKKELIDLVKAKDQEIVDLKHKSCQITKDKDSIDRNFNTTKVNCEEHQQRLGKTQQAILTWGAVKYPEADIAEETDSYGTVISAISTTPESEELLFLRHLYSLTCGDC